MLFMSTENPYLRLPETSHGEIIKVKSLTGGLNGKKIVGFLTNIFQWHFLAWRGREQVPGEGGGK